MRLVFSAEAWEDYIWWQTADRKMLPRINKLLKACLLDPETGIGKPEPLKYEWSGWWSRRINDDHRMVYRVESGDLELAMLRLHY